jgi:hypothetical protein
MYMIAYSIIRRVIQPLITNADNLFAPTEVDYGPASDSESNTPTSSEPVESPSPPTSVPSGAFKSPPVHLMNALDVVGQGINSWYLLQHFDELPSIIWDIWMVHKRSGQRDIFQEVIESDIADGWAHLERIKGIMLNGEVTGMEPSDLMDFLMQLSELQSRVHLVIATLQVRLHMVTSGLVDRFPGIMCPTDTGI